MPIQGPLSAQDEPMTDLTIRRNRSKTEPVVHMKSSLRQSTRDAFAEAAAASGLSLGLYLEVVAQHLRSKNDGGLPVFSPTLDDAPEAQSMSA